MRYMIAHWKTQPRSYKIISSDLRIRHPWMLMIIFPRVLPFHNGWMSRRTSFKARVVWVRPSVLCRTPWVSTPDSQLCPLVDTYQWTLIHCSCAREPHPCGTRCAAIRATLFLRHFKCRLRNPKSSFLLRVVISELGWLTLGASHLLGQMAATPALLPYMSSITLSQRYALETCRSMKHSFHQSPLTAQRWPHVETQFFCS